MFFQLFGERSGRMDLRVVDLLPDFSGKWLKYLYINDEKHIRSDRPVMEDCDCPVCRRYSAGYLRHLFKMGDSLFPRLATIHNVRVLTRLCDVLRVKKYG